MLRCRCLNSFHYQLLFMSHVFLTCHVLREGQDCPSWATSVEGTWSLKARNLGPGLDSVSHPLWESGRFLPITSSASLFLNKSPTRLVLNTFRLVLNTFRLCTQSFWWAVSFCGCQGLAQIIFNITSIFIYMLQTTENNSG